jgi:hypothetical protein
LRTAVIVIMAIKGRPDGSRCSSSNDAGDESPPHALVNEMKHSQSSSIVPVRRASSQIDEIQSGTAVPRIVRSRSGRMQNKSDLRPA